MEQTPRGSGKSRFGLGIRSIIIKLEIIYRPLGSKPLASIKIKYPSSRKGGF